jgi:hypothetical protein
MNAETMTHDEAVRVLRDMLDCTPNMRQNDEAALRYVLAALSPPPSEPPSGGLRANTAAFLDTERSRLSPSPAEQGAREEAGITCARCKGSGEGTVQVGVGPDAYDAPVMCEACGGSGAFDGTEPLRAFPTMLRKMWSGGDVQRWIDENIAPAYAAVCTMARRTPPLATGRVGVGVDDAMVRRALEAHRRPTGLNPETCTAYTVNAARMRAALEAALAGPVVAGEVEAVAWMQHDALGRPIGAHIDKREVRRIQEIHLRNGAPPPDFRPLVYADTAKGNGNGK